MKLANINRILRWIGIVLVVHDCNDGWTRLSFDRSERWPLFGDGLLGGGWFSKEPRMTEAERSARDLKRSVG